MTSSDRVSAIAGVSPRLTIRRHQEGQAYAVSGNAHNPTPRYVFILQVDGQLVDSDPRERVLRAAAKMCEVEYLAEFDAKKA